MEPVGAPKEVQMTGMDMCMGKQSLQV